MKPIIPFIFTALLIAGCASVDQENEEKAIISDQGSIHKIIKINGQTPEVRKRNTLVTYIPEYVVEPGEHEFTILYSKTKQISFRPEDHKEITITATVTEGYYELVDTGSSVILKNTTTP